jgi:hypothetical protein
VRCVASGVNGRWLSIRECWLVVADADAFPIRPAEGESGGELGICPFKAALGVSSTASEGSDEISITSGPDLRDPSFVFNRLVGEG